MSEEKLKEAILEKKTEELKRLEKEYEQKIEELKDFYEKKINEIDEKFLTEKEKIEKSICDKYSIEFKRKKLAYELEIENSIASLCKKNANEVLQRLWEESSEDFFKRKSDLSNIGKFKVVYVNERDNKLAKKYFLDLEIRCDPNISGGFILENEDETFYVDNTLNSRLEKVWDDILKDVIRDIYEKTGY
jgi:vacuolar-type H+-ATPase subunit E/Vma4